MAQYLVMDKGMSNGVRIKASAEHIAAVKGAKKLGIYNAAHAESSGKGASLYYLYSRAPRSTGATWSSLGAQVRIFSPGENAIADSI